MKKAVIFFLLLLVVESTSITAASAQGRGDTRIALLIANSNYPDDPAPLPHPSNDARALASELRRVGFEVEIGENLGRQAMQSAIDKFKTKAVPGSIAMVFFSGYAIQAGRQNYIIPINAQIWSEADVRRDGVAIESVLDEINSNGARAKLVIIDASRRNPFERRFRGFSAGLAPMTSPRGTLILYATLPSQLTNEVAGANSVFVGELLKEMRSPNLSIEQTFVRTRIGVSRVTNGDQVPWMSSSLAEDISLSRSPIAAAGVAAPVSTQSSIPAPAPSPVPPVINSSADTGTECDGAKQAGSKKAWSDYLARYPAGSCAQFARDQLAKLDQQPQVKPQFSNQAEDDRKILDLDQRLQRNPNDADAFYQRGQVYAKRADYNRAIDDFDKVITLNPKDAEAWNNRCWTRAVVGQLQAALRDCNTSLELQPNFADAYDSRGFVRLKMNDNVKAISDFNAALRGNPEQPSSLYGRGKAKLKEGDAMGGKADIEAAKTIKKNIAEEFVSYGVQ